MAIQGNRIHITEESADIIATLKDALVERAKLIQSSPEVNLRDITAAMKELSVIKETLFTKIRDPTEMFSDLPRALICPISKKLLLSPAVIITSQPFDQEHLEEWTQQSHGTNTDRGIMKCIQCVPAMQIQNHTIEWCHKKLESLVATLHTADNLEDKRVILGKINFLLGLSTTIRADFVSQQEDFSDFFNLLDGEQMYMVDDVLQLLTKIAYYPKVMRHMLEQKVQMTVHLFGIATSDGVTSGIQDKALFIMLRMLEIDYGRNTLDLLVSLDSRRKLNDLAVKGNEFATKIVNRFAGL